MKGSVFFETFAFSRTSIPSYLGIFISHKTRSKSLFSSFFNPSFPSIASWTSNDESSSFVPDFNNLRQNHDNEHENELENGNDVGENLMYRKKETSDKLKKLGFESIRKQESLDDLDI